VNKNNGLPSVPAPFPGSVVDKLPSLERLNIAHVRALMRALERDAETLEIVPTALREAYRILCEADLDAKGF
jgi:hypothetical protein